MLIRFYKSNQTATLFSIPILVALLWLPAWHKALLPVPDQDMPIFKLLQVLMHKLPTPLLPILGILLVSSLAILLNFLVNEFEVLYKKAHLTSLFFVLLASALPSNMVLSPALFASLILVFVLGRIFQLYKNDSALPITFELGFLIAIATLIYYPSLVFLLLLFIALIILRPFVWREWISPLIGFALPFAFLGLYYYWFDRMDQFIAVFANRSIAWDDIRQRLHLSMPELVFLGCIGLLALLSINKIIGNFFRNVIRTRNYQQVLLGMLFVAFLPLLFFSSVRQEILIIVAIPLSVFLGFYFMVAKRLWLMELVFIGLIGTYVFLHLH